MMYTVDIDTGGTMTDALVSNGERFIPIKTDTTPHDYTVSFVECLKIAAEKTGYGSISEFLEYVSLIRWTSTITTNIIAQRSGSKVGLIVSEGHEQDLYGNGKSAMVDEWISSDNIIGLPSGASHEVIMAAVKKLLEDGVRRICVSLKKAFPNNSEEKSVKGVIEDQYPDHILGSIPVLLGSEMAQLSHDQTRAHYAVINNYTHTGLASSLFKAEDVLKADYNYERPLLIGNTNGGVAKISKTKAVDTIESGPIFGTFAGAFVSKVYEKENVMCFDVGGTTTKASIVKNGEPVYQKGGELMEVPVETKFAMLRSAAVGGGSIARATSDGKLTLGPDSMGAVPGPACYGLGGDQATLTDCVAVLGYIDPNNFLGGRRTLDLDKAAKAIEKNVASPLGISVREAALKVRDEAVSIMATLVDGTLKEAGLTAEETSMFAFGGNGPMFGAFVAEALGIRDVTVFNFGPVFSAFGSAMSDVVHVYERGFGSSILGSDLSSSKVFKDAITNIKEQADRDVLGEGHQLDSTQFDLELEYSDGDDSLSLRIPINSESSDDFKHRLDTAIAAASAESDGFELARLSSRYEVSKKEMPLASDYKDRVIKTNNRNILFSNEAASTCELAYEWESLKPGDKLDGPTVINGSTISCPVPPGWVVHVDEYFNANLVK